MLPFLFLSVRLYHAKPSSSLRTAFSSLVNGVVFFSSGLYAFKLGAAFNSVSVTGGV